MHIWILDVYKGISIGSAQPLRVIKSRRKRLACCDLQGVCCVCNNSTVTEKKSLWVSRRGKGLCWWLLREIESAICRPDNLSSCLPSTNIKDVTEKFSQLTESIDYYPFVLSHVGTNDTTKKSLKKKISRDYEEPGKKGKEEHRWCQYPVRIFQR